MRSGSGGAASRWLGDVLMRVAVATNNGKTLALHAGRCKFFYIYEIGPDGKIVKLEERPNPHLDWIRTEIGVGHGRGRGFGRGMGWGRRHHEGGHGHELLFQAISDCDVLLAASMGRHIAEEAAQRGMRAIVTSERDIQKALEAFAKGTLREDGELH